MGRITVTEGVGMAQVTIREARANFRALTERAESGEEISILRRGKVVARLVPPARVPRRFPDLTDFRASLTLVGEPVSETVVLQRPEARY